MDAIDYTLQRASTNKNSPAFFSAPTASTYVIKKGSVWLASESRDRYYDIFHVGDSVSMMEGQRLYAYHGPAIFALSPDSNCTDQLHRQMHYRNLLNDKRKNKRQYGDAVTNMFMTFIYRVAQSEHTERRHDKIYIPVFYSDIARLMLYDRTYMHRLKQALIANGTIHSSSCQRGIVLTKENYDETFIFKYLAHCIDNDYYCKKRLQHKRNHRTAHA